MEGFFVVLAVAEGQQWRKLTPRPMRIGVGVLMRVGVGHAVVSSDRRVLFRGRSGGGSHVVSLSACRCLNVAEGRVTASLLVAEEVPCGAAADSWCFKKL
eukprot:361684-Chlamydomonas_euryale.AAC.8